MEVYRTFDMSEVVYPWRIMLYKDLNSQQKIILITFISLQQLSNQTQELLLTELYATPKSKQAMDGLVAKGYLSRNEDGELAFTTKLGYRVTD